MKSLFRAVARMPASLWVVASCGVLTGAMFAQEARPQAVAPEPAVAAAVVAGQAGDAASTDASSTGAASGTPLRFRDGSPTARTTGSEPAEVPPATGPGQLLVVLALLVACGGAVFFMRSKAPSGGKKTDKSLKVLSTVRVAGRWQVALVRVPGKTLVLGASEKGLSLLTSLEDDDDLDVAPADAIAFATDMPVLDTYTPERRPPASRGERASRQRPDAFLGRLLDELNAAPPEPPAAQPTPSAGAPPPPSPVRDRPLTPSAEALRQRLERFQRAAS